MYLNTRCVSIYLKAPLQMNLNSYLLFGCLRYLHSEKNVVHTDIKPENIMVRILPPETGGLFEEEEEEENNTLNGPMNTEKAFEKEQCIDKNNALYVSTCEKNTHCGDDLSPGGLSLNKSRMMMEVNNNNKSGMMIEPKSGMMIEPKSGMMIETSKPTNNGKKRPFVRNSTGSLNQFSSGLLGSSCSNPANAPLNQFNSLKAGLDEMNHEMNQDQVWTVGSFVHAICQVRLDLKRLLLII
jgi:hypothetical protein